MNISSAPPLSPHAQRHAGVSNHWTRSVSDLAQRRGALVVGLIGLVLFAFAVGRFRSISDGVARDGCVVGYRGESYTGRGAGADADAFRSLLRGTGPSGQSESKKEFWAAFVGDSIARNVLVAFMQSSGVETESVTFERHRDFEHVADGIRWTLHWAPFPRNASGVVASWGLGRADRADKASNNGTPDVIVVSSSLWHVLWVHDVDGYREALGGLVALLGAGDRVAVLNAPKVYRELLEDESKRRYMTAGRIDGYNAVLERAVCGAGGVGRGERRRSPQVVDVYGATAACGVGCSVDGIHSRAEVYVERIVPMVLDAVVTSSREDSFLSRFLSRFLSISPSQRETSS